jgi:hypothetical protein
MAILIAVAGCSEKGSGISVNVNGATTTCTYQWWVQLIWGAIGLGLLGIASFLWKNRIWTGVAPGNHGFAFLGARAGAV